MVEVGLRRALLRLTRYHVLRQPRPHAVAVLAVEHSSRGRYPALIEPRQFWSANEPCAVGCVLLDEVARECPLAASAAADLHRAAGKFRWAILCIFEQFESAMLRAIEPQDDALADVKRLVLPCGVRRTTVID